MGETDEVEEVFSEVIEEDRQARAEAFKKQYEQLLRMMPALPERYKPTDDNVITWWMQSKAPVRDMYDQVEWRNRTMVLACEVMKLRSNFQRQIKQSNRLANQVSKTLTHLLKLVNGRFSNEA